MPVPPPRGMSPAVAVRPAPVGVRVAAATGAAVAAVSLFLLNLSGAVAAVEPIIYGLMGLVGAAAVIVPKQTSYAAGDNWIRRGDNWVVTTALVEATTDGRTLRLSGASPRRRVALPVEVLTNNETMFAVLANGVRHSYADGSLQPDDRVRELFSLPNEATA